MKQQKKLIFGALLMLSGVAIALWLKEKPAADHPRPHDSLSRSATPAPPPAEVQPIGPPPQSVPAPKGASPGKKYSSLKVLERQAVLTEIGKQDLPAIFQAMIDAERVEHDPLKQQHLQTTLANAFLEKKPSPEFLEQLYGFLTNSGNSDHERGLLIGALGEAATMETVDFLLRVANTAPEQKIREAASTLGGVGADGRRQVELSPALEQAWRETTSQSLIMGTAFSMARLGTPSGVELLLSAALATDDGDKTRKIAAQAALRQVDAREAVPTLAARLANQPPTSEVVEMIAPILVKISGPTGHEALVSWLRTRPENAAPLVDDLVRQQIHVDPFETAWATALDPTVPFRNEANRQAIRSALAAYRAGHTSQP